MQVPCTTRNPHDGKRWYLLAKPHTHAGRDYQPGNKVRLTPDQAEWLEGLGVVSGLAEPIQPAKSKG